MYFSPQKSNRRDRIVSVLSDGLGSGVKASVLASMTATMALKFASSTMDIRESAEIIMDTLPICSVRKISYSTFTVVDMASTGETRIIEHDNPSFLLIRPKGEVSVSKTEVRLQRWQDRVIHFSPSMCSAKTASFSFPTALRRRAWVSIALRLDGVWKALTNLRAKKLSGIRLSRRASCRACWLQRPKKWTA
jgi:hypothetical protein